MSRRETRVWAPGHGWISPAQQRAIIKLYDSRRATLDIDPTAWGEYPDGVRPRTVTSLERLGLVEWNWSRGVNCVRLTEAGADIVRRWQEADAGEAA